LLASYNFTGFFQKNLKKLEGLFLELDLDALFAQFSSAEIKFEDTEANCPQLGWTGHGGTPHWAREFNTFSGSRVVRTTTSSTSSLSGAWPDYSKTTPRQMQAIDEIDDVKHIWFAPAVHALRRWFSQMARENSATGGCL